MNTENLTAQPHVAEMRGGAMGSSLHIIATGDLGHVEQLVDWAHHRVCELEQLWSRFIATSEVSRLNANPGASMVVSPETAGLIRRALAARELSGGRFDPTMLQALQANGYDRTFVSIKTPVGMPALDTRRIGLGQINIDTDTNTVTLADTTGFDPGGIGKGYAADVVAAEMMARGAAGALVNIGGDVRCIGHGPARGGWVIAVGDAVAGVENRVVELAQGAVASSTSRRRRWVRDTEHGPRAEHHLLNPTTGTSSPRAADLVTVIAGHCADAEWLATAIAAEGSFDSLAQIARGAAVMMTDCDGNFSATAEAQAFLR